MKKIERYIADYYSILGFLTPLVTYGGIIASIAISPWFSWTKNALSSLGETFRSSALIFNTTLITSGILIMIFGMGLFLKLRSYSKIVGVSYILTGFFLACIGIFPMNTKPTTHWIFAFLFFIFIGISSLLLGIHLVSKENSYELGILGILSAIIDISVWSLPWKTYGIRGVAIPELLSTIIPIILIILYSNREKRKSKNKK